MNRHQRVENSLHVRKINHRLVTLQVPSQISLRTPKDEANKIFEEKLLESIIRLGIEVTSYNAESTTAWIHNRLDYLAMELITSNVFDCYDEFIRIRSNWRTIKRTLA